MLNQESVSVIIPYSPNHTPRKMLNEAKDSVEAQSFPTDIIVIRDHEQRGPAWARNVGMDRASTQYVAFLDADDLWLADKLARQLDRMEQTGAGLCVEGSKTSTSRFTRELFIGNIESLTSSILINTNQVLVRFEEALERYEDHLFLLEAAREAEVCFCKNLVTIRKQEYGLSRRTNKGLLVEQREAFRELALRRVPETRDHLKTFDARLAYDRGRSYHKAGQYRTAISSYVNSITLEFHLKPVAALCASIAGAIVASPQRLLRGIDE